MKSRIASLLWLAGLVVAQSGSSQPSPTPSVVTLTGSQRSLTRDYLPDVTLPSDFEGSTIATTSRPYLSSSTISSNATMSISTSSSRPVTNLGGANNRTLTPTGTQSAPALPSNTQPCNNYIEFCNRKYSNITEVCAHNSPFTRARNIARNQDYGVTQQLNDGVRVLQGQAHYINNTLYFCHTSCDLLNAGTVEAYLREVTAWVEANPFDVVTIIFGNYDYNVKSPSGAPLVTSSTFAIPIESSGLLPYIYQPPKTVMNLTDWPTLGELILSRKRVVTFIDYNFDTDAVPYLLWEFYNVWETPYSPSSSEFPCTLGRPEGLSGEKMDSMLYMANHNLNAEINFGAYNLLVPNSVAVNETNAVNGSGSLGMMTTECTKKYNRPPTFLLVDFYNQGSTNGSVFEVAAKANNVTYDRPCCGLTARSRSEATLPMQSSSAAYFGLVVAVAAALVI